MSSVVPAGTAMLERVMLVQDFLPAIAEAAEVKVHDARSSRDEGRPATQVDHNRRMMALVDMLDSDMVLGLRRLDG